MNWQEACEHPSLKNLPFKIETNEKGELVMSPTKVYHSAYQGEISYRLRLQMKNGQVLTECAIRTSRGTKVADVAWASPRRFKRIKRETECSIAPEICVEVFSASNTDIEIKEKRRLYFEKGANEVWTCRKNGTMRFYNAEGKLKKSALCPDFPTRVKI